MWPGGPVSAILTSGFSFLGGASLGLQGVAEAKARFVSAGSGFQDFEFSGRRQPCLICAGLSDRLGGDTTLPGTDSLVVAWPISLTLPVNASRWTQLNLGGALWLDTDQGVRGLAIMQRLWAGVHRRQL